MFKIILIVVAVILLTIGLVWLVDKFIPAKFKPMLTILLWVLIFFLGYQTFMSIYIPIQFDKVKNERYLKVIENLIDIRDSQLAHRQVTGKFAGDFDGLVKFIDTAKYTINDSIALFGVFHFYIRILTIFCPFLRDIRVSSSCLWDPT